MIKTYHFEKLEVWQQSRQVVVAVYKLMKKFPAEERYGLCDQLRRAVISVPSNIAEGISRIAVKETIHFLEIAFGSLMEVYCQLQIAVDLEYITEEDFEQIKPLIHSTSNMLNGLHKAKKNQLSPLIHPSPRRKAKYTHTRAASANPRAARRKSPIHKFFMK